MNISNLSRTQKYGLLTALYFAQGVPFGLFTQAIPVVLRQANTSLAVIGLSSLLAAPWGLKFLWSPWLDEEPRWGTRRKGWLIPIQLLAVAAMIGLGFLDPWKQTGWVLATVLLVNFLNASQDVPTDGLAVDILTVDERGIGNGIQVGGYRFGMLMGGAAALLLIDKFGWSIGLFACAGSLLVALVPTLLVQESPSETTAEDSHGPAQHLRILWTFLKRPGIARIIAVIVAFKIGDALGGGMIRPMLVDQGFTMKDIGEIAGGVGFTASMIGTAIGAGVADYLSRRVALMVAVVFQTLGAGVYILVLMGATDRAMVAGVISVENVLGSIATVVLFTCMMDWTRTEHSGADYTLLAAIVVVATGIGSLLSGVSAQTLGYLGHHAVSAAVCLVGGIFAVAMYRDPTA